MTTDEILHEIEKFDPALIEEMLDMSGLELALALHALGWRSGQGGWWIPARGELRRDH